MSTKCSSLAFLLQLVNAASSLVITQDTVSVTVPAQLPSSVPIYEVITVDNVIGLRIYEATYKIVRTTAFSEADVITPSDVFILKHSNDSVYLHVKSDNVLLDFTNFTISVEIQGCATGDHFTPNLTVVVNVVDWGDNPCIPQKELCFLVAELIYKIPESLRVGTVVGSVKPAAAQHFCPDIQYSYSLPDTSPLLVDEATGEIYIAQELDFEKLQRYDMNLTCQMDVTDVSTNTSESASFNTDVTVLVKDVDDNAPYMQQSTESLQEMDSSAISPGKTLPLSLSVLDKDSYAVNNISVALNDPLNLFSLKDTIIYSKVKNMMFISAVIVAAEQFSFPDETYNFSAIFVDESLITDEENKVVFHVVITNKTHSTVVHYKPPKDFQIAVNISRNSGVYTRVAQPLQGPMIEGYEFHLESKRRRRIFSVTPKTGIIYVKNQTLLKASNFNSVHLNLTRQHNQGLTENHCMVLINVHDYGEEVRGCAVRDSEMSCTRSCGKGSPDGLCKWRRHPDLEKPVQAYGTCSPDFTTCPDGICDELEATHISICPQDCTVHIVGEGFLSRSGRGIGLAAGPCGCDEMGQCSCVKDHARGNRTHLEARNRVRGKDHHSRNASVVTRQKKTVIRLTSSENLNGRDESSVCGPRCLIAVGVISISTVLLAVFITVFHYVRQSQNQHKYVGNRVPLTAVTSDYVVTASSSAASDTQFDSNQNSHTATSKWEFPRDRLVCQETLGEGEFGKVIKAQAWEIAGRPGYTTVAVKMIKETGTDSEVQDLISELNLLKEVSHPNIIQLLGACTMKGGPLYVIVEYAERGSLRNYLRQLRRSQEGPRCGTVCNPSYFEEDCLRRNHDMRRELFSFAWQISKGMAYLADMKVVHRDLAARNILLMENKIIKISDFGLSRDVYEGDTYLKTTKTRVPVKWMAIESLGDHVYTTKSDVWSFGIVLWELITLGANPYPGIMSEGLYHMLKDGYRMPKPDNCPEDFYQTMFSCWRAIPGERPSFKELVQKLERLLQDTVDYLPLSADEARTANKREDDASTEHSSSPQVLPLTDDNSKTDGFSSNGPSLSKRNKISKACLLLPRIPDTNYESRRLLQTPSEESTSA